MMISAEVLPHRIWYPRMQRRLSGTADDSHQRKSHLHALSSWAGAIVRTLIGDLARALWVEICAPSYACKSSALTGSFPLVQ